MRGRKKLHDSPIIWRAHIPRSIAAAVEDKLRDPLTGQVEYAAKAKLTEQLLRDWLKKTDLSSLLPEEVNNA